MYIEEIQILEKVIQVLYPKSPLCTYNYIIFPIAYATGSRKKIFKYCAIESVQVE